MRKRESPGSPKRKPGTSKQFPSKGKTTSPGKPVSSSKSRYSSFKQEDDTASGKRKQFLKGGKPDFKKFDKSKDDVDRKKKFTKQGDRFADMPKQEGEGQRSGNKGFFNKLGSKRSRVRKYSSSNKQPEPTIANLTGKIRLNRYIANSGVCSRREADELIKLGLVSVNGKVITEMGYQVSPGDEVRHEDKRLRAEKPVYILMNKPKGYLTTTKDPQDRNTVMKLIANDVKERVYPIGRLDRNTTGLLMLTNDGELADKLSHPSYVVKKIYKVELDKALTKTDFQKILDGVQLEEGRAMVDDLAYVSEDKKTIGIELHIGWNRVIRRIFERLDYEVIRLDRSVYAGLDKKDLPRGHWRYLTNEEIVRLKHYNKPLRQTKKD